MNWAEAIVAENVDEAIRRSALRFEQESIHLGMLQNGGNQHTCAKASLEQRTAALDRLKVYRAQFA